MSKDVVLKGIDRRLSNKASIFEVVRIIGVRTEHLNHGGPAYVDSVDADNEDIAIRELIEQKCPFKMLRKLSRKDGITYYEEWNMNELIIDYSKLSI